MSDWPAWHPGLELRAAHLLGLEDYVLARTSLDAFSHGVEALDVRHDLHRIPAAGGLHLRLIAARGVTPSGRPVVVSRDTALETLLGESPSTTYVVDLWVEVNAIDARDRKLTLRAASALAQGPAFDVLSHPDALYLGRFRLHQHDAPELVARPYVRTLAAIRPQDAAWHEWVKPVPAVIRAIHAYADRRARTSASLVPLHVEASALMYRWPTTPVHELATRLAYLHWLKRQAASTSGYLEPAFHAQPFPPATATGDQIPRLLASLAAPEERAGVQEVLGAVLDRIYLRVPLDDFRQWREWIAQPETVADVEAVVEAIRTRPQRPRFERWTRAAGLLTIHAFERAELVKWPASIVGPYLDGTGATDVPRALANTLDQLIGGEGLQWPAGPLGLREIVLAAARASGVVAAASPRVRAYIEEASRRIGDSQGPAPDRVTAFLRSRRDDAGEIVSRVEAASIVGSDLRRHCDEVSAEIVVLGTPQSGKTGFVRALHRASIDGSAPALPLRMTFAPHLLLDSERPMTSPRSTIERFEARLETADQSGRMIVTEIPSDAVTAGDPTVSAILARATMIVVMLDAALLDRAERPVTWFRQLDAAIGPALRGRPDVHVAIAFSKSDEFGTVDPRSLRVLSRLEEHLLLERLRDASPANQDAAWRQFVDGVSLPSRLGEAWGETRRRLLEQTRELWIALIRERHHLGVNGYFISADPVDRYFEPWARRGVLQLMADGLSAVAAPVAHAR